MLTLIITRLYVVMAILAVAMLTSANTHAEDTLLGEIDFPNSGAPEAQRDFLDGVLYMHNFEYRHAANAFKRAQDKDKDFAMAYWGEAMTYNKPLWGQQARTEARDVLRKLGRTSKKRAEKAVTEREQGFIEAAEILFGMTDETKSLTKFERDVSYRDAMRRLHEKYPDDLEAAAFHGLSILGVGMHEREYTQYMRAAAELMDVWDRNRNHPGAAHYLIHSYDDPVHAPLGLPMARAYSRIAPGAAHAQHMTSHIFVAMGMWDDLIQANEIADRVERESQVSLGDQPKLVNHYLYWLEYGYNQQGRLKDSRELLTAAKERIDEGATSSEKGYYGSMVARYLIDGEDWASAKDWIVKDDLRAISPNYYFGLAYAALMSGDLESAREHTKNIAHTESKASGETMPSEESIEVLHKQLDARFAMADGNAEKAIALMQEAVVEEEAITYSFGPPRIVKPSGELLGDILLEAGKPVEAVAAYKAQLERTPGRTRTLIGLLKSAEASDDDMTAADARAQLAGNLRNADTGFEAPGNLDRTD